MSALDAIREQYERAARERSELRSGDSLAGPRACCGHEGRNHGPDGCCMPGCECTWPKSALRAAERVTVSRRDLAALFAGFDAGVWIASERIGEQNKPPALAARDNLYRALHSDPETEVMPVDQESNIHSRNAHPASPSAPGSRLLPPDPAEAFEGAADVLAAHAEPIDLTREKVYPRGGSPLTVERLELADDGADAEVQG